MIDAVIADSLRDGILAVLAIGDAQSDAFLGSLVFFDITAGVTRRAEKSVIWRRE